jgi:hypothetical protein
MNNEHTRPVSLRTIRLASRLFSLFLLLSCLAWNAGLHADGLPLPEGVQTYPDGRMPIYQVYDSILTLQQQGWIVDIVSQSQPDDLDESLPIIALRTEHAGDAIWIMAGIHGEETAGPNAIAASIADLVELGKHRAVVLLPLNNPYGYARNWRYLNMASYSAETEGQSVGDSSHLLIDPDDPERARADAASSPEADAITSYVVAMSESYPPRVSVDLHEDLLIHEGYVYSQGKLGAEDPLATLAVKVLIENDIPLKMNGLTRFDEEITDGIIGPVIDSSIDELMSASEVMVDSEIRPGPTADTVLVFETPAGALPLDQRVKAHQALLRMLVKELSQPATNP